MTRGRSATMSFVGFGGFTDFGSSGLPKVRCGFTSPRQRLKLGAAFGSL